MVALGSTEPLTRHTGSVTLKNPSKILSNGLPAEEDGWDGAPAEPDLHENDPDWGKHLPVTEINSADLGTRDAWVPRHPELIRLTGRHPFNCEPPPSLLHDSGFLTPVSLHYVRNHGAVPQIKWSEHRVVVNGLVHNPTTFTMDEILKFPATTVTCTLTCAGNRRKEENMVKKTIGFNWGPAGTACGEWTGVRLSDILTYCGIKDPSDDANFVCFRGPRGELPQGKDGVYGTSITHYKAMDAGSDVILAYKHNGRLLTPDHGYPIRIIIPGFIGGRMVKWLEEITVTSSESDNHYHYHDNRVLPSHIDAETANKEGWWYKPDFMITDLNINSAITYPAHDELVPLAASAAYTIKGYAYCGGGHKIIRCEVSLDDGLSWKLADIHRYEKPNIANKYYAWVFWSLALPIPELMNAKEIMCRAWDDCMNTQPNSFTWNVMGMMNNCVYRVKVKAQATPPPTASLALHFEHPTLAAGTPGGWMNRVEDAPAAAPAAAAAVVAPVAAAAAAPAAKLISMEEVEQHTTMESAWFVYHGKVYDGTPFLEEHPGGADSIILVAGTDATEEFDAIHSTKAKKMLEKYYIGDLAPAGQLPPPAAASAAPALANGSASTAAAVAADVHTNGNSTAAVANGHTNGHANGHAEVALNPKKRITVPLIEREDLSHDSRRLRFALPSPDQRLGLPCGQHVFVYARVGGDLVMRAYTPVSRDEVKGYVEFVIKVYFGNSSPEFPLGGKMSQHLETLKVGDTVELKGPTGHFHYLGRGRYTLHGHLHTAQRFNAVAGGTGITPIYQVMQAILADPEDPTEVRLVYANRTHNDILLLQEIDAMATDARIRVHHVLSKDAPEGFACSRGRVCLECLTEHTFPADDQAACLMCGPGGLIDQVCQPAFQGMGFPKEKCIVF